MQFLFYFFLNVLRYDYVSGKFARTKSIGTILKNDFEDYIKFEPSILKIIRRVNIMPHGLLQMAREIKRTLLKE